MAGLMQAFTHIHQIDGSWTVSLSDEWDVLGPFPIHAREQHFLSPSFPLNLSRHISYDVQWLSSYPDFSHVTWSKATSRDGLLTVSYPEVRWASLRATEGWAALQHHSLLRTTFTIYPPSGRSDEDQKPLRILFDLTQGSFFTVVPHIGNGTMTKHVVPRWYSGNIYDLGASSPQVVDLPFPPSTTGPTSYDLFISGDYEIRLFGDPSVRGSGVPELQIGLSLRLEDPTIDIQRQVSHDIVPDYVGGWAFGHAIGIGVHSADGWWTVGSLIVDNSLSEVFRIELLQDTRIAPTQTRIIPIRLTQLQSLLVSVSDLQFKLVVTNGSVQITIPVVIPIRHHTQWGADQFSNIKATYFYANSMPTAFMVMPPYHPSEGDPTPPVLALHGAGVEVLSTDFWLKALPRQNFSWTIAPTGRTSWGLDWHGPSSLDAWATVDSLHDILQTRPQWRQWGIAEGIRVAIVGHSNGGQGTWYTAARYPDRVVVAIPAAAYIKSQAYIPLTQSRSGHFIDPSLRAILESSLTPDDNDLFLTNLVDTPILAIHGGDDENVPVWHTREAVSILKTWRPDAPAIFREDPGKSHWYPDVFDNDFVQTFLRTYIKPTSQQPQMLPSRGSFTLTVAVPSESGSMHGWEVLVLKIPGRLARLTVNIDSKGIHVKTTNVKVFSVTRNYLSSFPALTIDGHRVNITPSLNEFTVSIASDNGYWKVVPTTSHTIQPSGRLLQILSSTGPLILVVPNTTSSPTLSAALRIAHDLDLYHKLDSEIIGASEVLSRLEERKIGPGNLVVLGGTNNSFLTYLLEQEKTPFRLQDGKLYLNGKLVQKTATSLFLHPHPTSLQGLSLIMHYNDEEAMERALRLFPIRTGVAVPDWIIVGEDADKKAAGGVIGAGVWGNEWSWNEVVSSF